MNFILKHKGYEVWANFDDSARVYELFFDENAEVYVGVVDSLAEARVVARQLIDEVTA